jgi:hypothetical protein
MAWVKIRIQGEQKGRIIAAFALLGVQKDRITFYEMRNRQGFSGYASVDIKPPAGSTQQTTEAPAPPVAKREPLYTRPTTPEPNHEALRQLTTLEDQTIGSPAWTRTVQALKQPPATPPRPTTPPPPPVVATPPPLDDDEPVARPVINRRPKKSS